MNARIVGAFAIVSIFPAIAAAAPEGVNPKEAQHGVDVMAQADIGAVTSQGPAGPQGALGLGLRALYRLTPRLALGGSATRTYLTYATSDVAITDGNYYATDAVALWRGGAVLQYDYAVLGPLRAWIAGETGIAFATERSVAFGPDLSSHAKTDLRVAPWLGASTGLEVRPIPYVSIGLRLGAMHAAFGAAEARASNVPGSAQSLFGGLDLGFHYPID